jgi:hypothetical protein
MNSENPAAFPGYDRSNAVIGGMSLRDYFAAKVLPIVYRNSERLTNDMIAREAYEMADAMLKERSK